MCVIFVETIIHKKTNIMYNNLLEKPLISATLGDWLEVQKMVNAKVEEKPRKLVYGIAGLASIVNCSIPTAQRIKNSGKVRYIQNGRKLVFDVEQVLADLAK